MSESEHDTPAVKRPPLKYDLEDLCRGITPENQHVLPGWEQDWDVDAGYDED